MWWDCGRWFLMQNYEKPEVILMTECSEGVYLASGGQTRGRSRRQVDVTAGDHEGSLEKAGLQQQQCADACL